MRLGRDLSRLFGSFLAGGLFVRLRQAGTQPKAMVRAFVRRNSVHLRAEVSDQIVVAGIGPSALACLRELRAEGFTNVTVVAKDDLFGGKCVNYGCMPTEFVMSQHGPVAAEAVQDFVTALREDVEQQFAELGYPIVGASVDRIVGGEVLLSDGTALPFDRLVLAIGGEFTPPPLLRGHAELCSIEEFWTLPTGSRVTIVAETNAWAITLGEIAQRLGLVPTVLLGGSNPMFQLPSFRFFVREIRSRGVTIHEQVRLRGEKKGKLVVTAGAKALDILHDRVLAACKPGPRFVEIDGTIPSVFDLDLTRGTLPARPDIFFAGDGGGLMTASEAELQARLMVREWKTGERLDLRVIGQMPLVIHGSNSLAMVGPEWTLLEKKWHEVDFRGLGWSRISRLEGRVWYVWNDQTSKIEAIHICHRLACDLIAVAAVLKAYPVRDLVWAQGFTHPSAAEIFKLVANHARALGRSAVSAALSDEQLICEKYALPDLRDIDSNHLPEWLDLLQWNKAVLKKNPKKHLAACYALHRLELLSRKTFDIKILNITDDDCGVIEGDCVTVDLDDELHCVGFSHGLGKVIVQY